MSPENLARCVLVALPLLCAPAWAQNVKITPIGSHAGELCDRDRATLFEDPNGVRILYDAGTTVTGGDDPRLGTVHVVLLSHAHGDHLGDRKLKAPGGGTCAAPETVSAAPNSTTAEVAAAKNAGVMVMAPMAGFLGKKIEVIRGKPTGACTLTGDEVVVPLPSVCLLGVHLGGARMFKTSGATRSVEITAVPAAHDSTVSRELLTDPEKKDLDADNVSLTLGPPIGYVIRFTNGLTVYLSGDTAIHSDMKTVVGDFHKPNLALFNLGINAVTSVSAGYAINDLVHPAAVVVTHVNEAATKDGKILPNSRTAAFANAVKGRAVYPALSDKTMEFDGNAKCVSGC